MSIVHHILLSKKYPINRGILILQKFVLNLVCCQIVPICSMISELFSDALASLALMIVCNSLTHQNRRFSISMFDSSTTSHHPFCILSVGNDLSDHHCHAGQSGQ